LDQLNCMNNILPQMLDMVPKEGSSTGEYNTHDMDRKCLG